MQTVRDETEFTQNISAQECSMLPRAAPVPRRRSDVRRRVVEGETVVLDRHGGLIHQFNHTASYIWERCDGTATVADIAQQLAAAFGVDAQMAADDVAALVAQLHTVGLLEPPARSASRPAAFTL